LVKKTEPKEYKISNFILSILLLLLLLFVITKDGQIKEIEMGGTCSTQGRKSQLIKYLGQRT
jgi:hypothetical protein